MWRARQAHAERFVRGVPEPLTPAAEVFCRRGVWYRSHTPGITVAYPNAWFHKPLVSTVSMWEELNRRPKLASRQTAPFDL